MNRKNYATGFSPGYDRDALLTNFLASADLAFDQKTKGFVPIFEWCKKVNLGGRPFQIEGHEFERAMLEEEAPRQCFKKGAQIGITETQILKTMHGLLYSRYPQGVLYLFPTVNDVTDFSKGRFGPLLAENEAISEQVSSTDAVAVKRVRKAMLYLRGARATGKIEGQKKTSSQLKSVPVDRIVFDEVDEMESEMVDLALERMSHSTVKEEIYLSTPSICNFGIDRLYNESDGRIWVIRCPKCQRDCCLELDFPECVKFKSDGKAYRACVKCGGELHPKDGRWIAQYPDRKDMAGFWISQLNSIFVDPGKILKAFNDPPNGNKAEVYNSKLAMAFVNAQDQLVINDVYGCCRQDAMAMNHRGPCAMGVDVGAMLHVVVGFRPKEKQLQICYLARVSSFSDIHDIAQRFGVRSAVIDMEPELRKAREFAQAEPYPVFLCDYQDSITTEPVFDEERRLVKVNRTLACDASHDLIFSNLLVLPRRNEEVEIFAKQCCNLAKVLEENPETGSRQYRYRKLNEDHYRHALNYFCIAARMVGLYEEMTPEKEFRKFLRRLEQETNDANYSPFSHGLRISGFGGRGERSDYYDPLSSFRSAGGKKRFE